MQSRKPAPPSLLPLNGAVLTRPALAIGRFQATLAQAVGAIGIGAEEASFLADLQAVLNYVHALEVAQARVTRPGLVGGPAPVAPEEPDPEALAPIPPKPH